jgi:hypothetical protein
MSNNWVQNNEKPAMQNIKAGKTLRGVVMSVLNRVSNPSMNEYKKLMQIAIECVSEEIRLYHASSIEVLYTEVSETGIVQMPGDCLKYIKIGVNLGGFLYILGMNDDIVLSRGTKCGSSVDDISRLGLAAFSPVDGYYFTDHADPYGNYVSTLYGMGGGFTSPQYRYDEKLKRFQLTGPSLYKKQVIIEYQSTGVSASTIIEPELIRPIRNYLIWQRIENDPRVSMGEKDRKEKQYNDAIEMMRTYKNMFTMQEFLDGKYRATKQGIKR